jgi:hypothetical protein
MTQSHKISQTTVKLVREKRMGCEKYKSIGMWVLSMAFYFYDNGMRITTNVSISNTTYTHQEQDYMFRLYTDKNHQA